MHKFRVGDVYNNLFMTFKITKVDKHQVYAVVVSSDYQLSWSTDYFCSTPSLETSKEGQLLEGAMSYFKAGEIRQREDNTLEITHVYVDGSLKYKVVYTDDFRYRYLAGRTMEGTWEAGVAKSLWKYTEAYGAWPVIRGASKLMTLRRIHG